MLHVVCVGTTIAPHVAGDPPFRHDVVVAAHPANVFLPGPYADEGGMVGIGEDFLRFGDVDEELWPLGDWCAKLPRWRRAPWPRFEPVSGPYPSVVTAVQDPDVSDPGIAQDQRSAAGGNLAGPPSRPFVLGVAFRVATVQNYGRVVCNAEGAKCCLELSRRPAVPIGAPFQPIGIEVERLRQVIFFVLLGQPKVDVK